MKFKKWNFPTFEEWDEKGRDYKGSLGEFYCEIKAVSWGNEEANYGVGISTSNVPHNFYVDRVVSDYRRLNMSDRESIREWYNTAIKIVQEKWEKYLMETYFEADVDNAG